MHELLTPSQMASADKLTIDVGTPGIELMNNAGHAVAKSVHEHYPNSQNILVVCGTGNNGGDGFVAAHQLASQGKNVQVLICGGITRISGDAELALAKLERSMLVADTSDLASFDLLVDALFGAGLDREVKGELSKLITRMNNSKKPIMAVDLPSGIDGTTGQIMGTAIKASHTVTFFRRKPGHLLFPGRHHCGKCALYQIGIEESALQKTGIAGLQNCIEVWKENYPFPTFSSHKYNRGHTVVVSGHVNTSGAARLTAQAALRSGSGLVTLASTTRSFEVNAKNLLSVMIAKADNTEDMGGILDDQRINCVAIGPGMEPGKDTREMVLTILKKRRKTILDAGALTAFSENPGLLFEHIKASHAEIFLTPHEGEFARLFPDEALLPSKIDREHKAAEKSGATIILKGADTIVATPQGQISVSDNAPAWLATAGSGDVLCGIIAGFSSQGMAAFEAASAAVWFHGDAAQRTGPGMISSDLDAGLRESINRFVLEHTS